MKSTSHGQGFYQSHLFILNTVKLWQVPYYGSGDDWLKFEINMTIDFWETLAKIVFSHNNENNTLLFREQYQCFLEYPNWANGIDNHRS